MKIIRFGSLVGTFYPQKTSYSKWLIIVAIGAPNLEDIENLRNSDILNSNGYDIFVPEYYGYCRSGGLFSPSSSLQTLLDTYDAFCFGYVWDDISTSEKFIKKYKRIFFLGLSYGGSIVPIIPRFRPGILGIGCFYPVLEYLSLWKIGVPEETWEEFLRSIKNEFPYIYRGIKESTWNRHFQHKTDIIPTQSHNIDVLKWINLFLAHWEDDISISFKRTKFYYQNLREHFPEQNIIYQQYPWMSHGWDTLMIATDNFICWLDSL